MYFYFLSPLRPVRYETRVDLEIIKIGGEGCRCIYTAVAHDHLGRAGRHAGACQHLPALAGVKEER